MWVEHELVVCYLFELLSTEHDGKKRRIYLKELKRIFEAERKAVSVRSGRSAERRKLHHPS